MKMSKERYEEIRDGMKNVVKRIGVEQLRQSTLSGDALYYQLFYVMYNDFQSNLDKGNDRINPFKSYNWLNNLYNEVNDSHIATALRKIGKELGI